MTKILSKPTRNNNNEENSSLLFKAIRHQPTNQDTRQRRRKQQQQHHIIQLCDLPTEILEMIICNINIWHRNRIRATCTRLRNCCDSRLMHDFKSSLSKYGRINRTGYEFSALQVRCFIGKWRESGREWLDRILHCRLALSSIVKGI